MNKENYQLLKSDLKNLAKKLKEHKSSVKKSQRILSNFEYRVGHYDSLTGRESDKQEWVRLYSPASNLQSDLLELKSDYRAMHILYSLERGRTLDQIENPKSGYWKDITYKSKLKKYVKKYEFENYEILPKETLVSLGWIEGNGQIRLFTREEMPGYKKPGTKRRVFARKVGGKI